MIHLRAQCVVRLVAGMAIAGSAGAAQPGDWLVDPGFAKASVNRRDDEIRRFGERLAGTMPFSGVCRPAAASPATGWSGRHKLEHARLLKAALHGH